MEEIQERKREINMRQCLKCNIRNGTKRKEGLKYSEHHKNVQDMVRWDIYNTRQYAVDNSNLLNEYTGNLEMAIVCNYKFLK